MKKIKTLPLIVFLTGASVLIIEITATRILSPFFGNTVYSVSGIISVILLALSIGYYIGGILADKKPYHWVFYLLILLSGIATITIQIISFYIIPSFSSSLSLSTGPIITSMLLFFLPGLILGMLSPYAVKLQSLTQQDQGIGQTSGTIFFFSTCGSITGSLLASFYLIPTFGISQIILGVGTLLTLMGLSGVLYYRKEILKKNLAATVTTILIFSLGYSTLFTHYNKNLIYLKDGTYEQIMIYMGKYDGKAVKMLSLDGAGSSAMYPDSDELVFPYSKFFEAYKVFSIDLKNALVVGGGAYSIPKAIIKENNQVKVDVVEIEPLLEPLSKEHFDLKSTDRIKTYITDGRRYLIENDTKYELIFSDAFSTLHTIPSHLATKESTQLVHDSLADNGIYVINLHGNLKDKRENLVYAMIKTFESVFPQVYTFALRGSDKDVIQNIVLVASKNPQRIDFTRNEISNHASSFIRQIPNYYVPPDKDKINKAILLTDNYAPVDYLGRDLYN